MRFICLHSNDEQINKYTNKQTKKKNGNRKTKQSIYLNYSCMNKFHLIYITIFHKVKIYEPHHTHSFTFTTHSQIYTTWMKKTRRREKKLYFNKKKISPIQKGEKNCRTLLVSAFIEFYTHTHAYMCMWMKIIKKKLRQIVAQKWWFFSSHSMWKLPIEIPYFFLLSEFVVIFSFFLVYSFGWAFFPLFASMIFTRWLR